VLDIPPLLWGLTIGLVVLLLAVDLLLAAVRPHKVGFREATAWSVFYVALAIGFGVWFTMAFGGDFGTQYFAGYLVEKSLSVDNLFVFVIIMTTFAVPDEHQHKVLTFGIVLALIMRAIFIALGAALLSLFSGVFLLFGLLLIFTAIQLFRHRDEDPDIEDNAVVKGARRLLPVTDDYVGGKLVTRVDGRRMVTPAVLGAPRHRQHRPALRPRLHPGRVRGDQRALHRVRGERVRPARAARPVLPGPGSAGPAGLPLHRVVDHPRLHRRQADPALGARRPRAAGAGDPDPAQPGGDHCGAGVVTVASLVKTRRDPTAKAHAGSLRASHARTEDHAHRG